MAGSKTSESREHLLTVAEKLFSERGYAVVTLKDIADELGIRQASLYYHVPGGKEALFVEVTERGLRRHRSGLDEAIKNAGNSLRDKLRAAARWIIAEPMPDLGRMSHSDMPEISEAHAQRLMYMTYESLLVPVGAVFKQAYENGEIAESQSILLAGAFISIMSGVHNLPTQFLRQSRAEMADHLIEVLLNGLYTR